MVEHLPDIAELEEGICFPQENKFFNAEINANTYDTSYSHREPTLKGIQKKKSVQKRLQFLEKQYCGLVQDVEKVKSYLKANGKNTLRTVTKNSFFVEIVFVVLYLFLERFPAPGSPNHVANAFWFLSDWQFSIFFSFESSRQPTKVPHFFQRKC